MIGITKKRLYKIKKIRKQSRKFAKRKHKRKRKKKHNKSFRRRKKYNLKKKSLKNFKGGVISDNYAQTATGKEKEKVDKLIKVNKGIKQLIKRDNLFQVANMTINREDRTPEFVSNDGKPFNLLNLKVKLIKENGDEINETLQVVINAILMLIASDTIEEPDLEEKIKEFVRHIKQPDFKLQNDDDKWIFNYLTNEAKILKHENGDIIWEREASLDPVDQVDAADILDSDRRVLIDDTWFTNLTKLWEDIKNKKERDETLKKILADLNKENNIFDKKTGSIPREKFDAVVAQIEASIEGEDKAEKEKKEKALKYFYEQLQKNPDLLKDIIDTLNDGDGGTLVSNPDKRKKAFLRILGISSDELLNQEQLDDIKNKLNEHLKMINDEFKRVAATGKFPDNTEAVEDFGLTSLDKLKSKGRGDIDPEDVEGKKKISVKERVKAIVDVFGDMLHRPMTKFKAPEKPVIYMRATLGNHDHYDLTLVKGDNWHKDTERWIREAKIE